MSIEEKLMAGVEAMDLQISEDKLQQLVTYVSLLNKWNKAFNLTAIRNPDDMVSRHILDSLSTLPYVSGNRILDVGTGPGLPGIPLSICYPEKSFVLLDSNVKKTRFLTQCRLELGLGNIEVIHSRADEFIREEKFDMIVSRAFAPLKNIIGWCQHLLSDNGLFLAMKGPYPAEEIDALPKEFSLQESIAVSIPGDEAERNLLLIAKNNE